MLLPKSILVYNWFDIQKELCIRMGIKEEYFRQYHLHLKETEYKDLWHIVLEAIIPPNMQNDTIVTLYDLGLNSDDKKWTSPLFKAYHNLMLELDPDDLGINVKFSW